MNPDFTNANELFRKELYYKAQTGRQVAIPCHIHDVFRGLNAKSHNCIGCNFAESTNAIERVLNRIAASWDFEPEVDYSDYLMWLYLFVERANMLFDIIKLPESYRQRHFGVFMEIKRWANFLKHPNYFILVHHPTFQAGGTNDPKKTWDVIVDTKFVMEHYGHDSLSKDLKHAFQNKIKVLVLFPDVVPLTQRFCDAVKRFVAVIVDNPVFREVLDDIATYDDYFEAISKRGGS